METEVSHPDRTAIAIVSGIVDVLKIGPHKQSAPDVRVIVRLFDILAAVVQMAVAQKKAKAAEFQVVLMVG